jgi:hypothetical protein
MTARSLGCRETAATEHGEEGKTYGQPYGSVINLRRAKQPQVSYSHHIVSETCGYVSGGDPC